MSLARRPLTWVLVGAALLLCMLAACSRVAPETPWEGSYRAALQLPGGELPFGLEIAREGNALVAWLINGAERVKVTEVTQKGTTITLQMPGYENVITATREGSKLRGELFMIKAGGKNQHIPFTAQSGQPSRFFPEAAAAGGDISGRWAAEFTDQDGARYIGVGEFAQVGADVTGTFLTPTGDYRYLTGELRDGKLFLGTFNGGHVFLFHAALDATGNAMTGDYWSGLAWHEQFTARRDANASLGKTTAVTAMQAPRDRFDFTFPDLEGKSVSLRDARFAGKVVVVTLAGSWCPNCHDEAAYLAPYFRTNQAAGLEIVGLMFEQLETPAAAQNAVRRFRDRHAIAYPLLMAGISDNAAAALQLPQLNGVYAYPTTIFIDRKGIVRHIHTGFSGPATGTHYTDLIRDFDQRIRALLAEAA